jgi:hypothetical protein
MAGNATPFKGENGELLGSILTTPDTPPIIETIKNVAPKDADKFLEGYEKARKGGLTTSEKFECSMTEVTPFQTPFCKGVQFREHGFNK